SGRLTTHADRRKGGRGPLFSTLAMPRGLHGQPTFRSNHSEVNTMAAISASLVKELRERTGLGMMECKKALSEADGDIDLAIENLRKNSGLKAAKKAGRTAAEGVVVTRVAEDGSYGVL